MLSSAPMEENRIKKNNEILDQCLFQIAGQDYAALEEFYNRTSASVYAYALSVLKNTHDAEDVLHDLYILVCGSAGTYHSEGKPMAWILTITRTLCMQKLREHQRTADIPQEDWENYIQSAPMMGEEDKIVLYECLKNLTEQERQIVVLHAVSGFKHREIAQFLYLPLSTVLSKYNRALKKLRRLYEA